MHRRIATRRMRLSGLGEMPGCAMDAQKEIPNPPNQSDLPVWLYPPSQWENVDQLNYVAMPAVGADATIITFQVPTGRNGVIQKVANNFVGAGWTEGSGDLVWRILVDGATPPGANSYQNILGSLGSPANPVGISGFRIFENQVLTLIAHNNALVVAGQLVGGRLVGYLYPREYEDTNIWI
jgi:hypothetical protein